MASHEADLAQYSHPYSGNGYSADTSEPEYESVPEESIQPSHSQSQGGAGAEDVDEPQSSTLASNVALREHFAVRHLTVASDAPERTVPVDGTPLVIRSGHHTLLITSGRP